LLGEKIVNVPDMDYISFKINNEPSILTHYGFWAELASLTALDTADKLGDKKHHKHVTSYIYTPPNLFNILWLDAREDIDKEIKVRLTVDDINDFNNAKNIYHKFGEEFDTEIIIDFINNNNDIKKEMINQILKHRK
jgi:spore coat polysaccharide biosynthesis protein SpsF